jgi:mRNA interferase HigB
MGARYMNLVGVEVITKAQATHPRAAKRLAAWKAEVQDACWRSPLDVHKRYPSADRVGDRYVFDIGGNRYRLIVGINFAAGVVRALWFGTHADYDKIKVEEV